MLAASLSQGKTKRTFLVSSDASCAMPHHGASLIRLKGRGSLPLSSNFTKSRRPGCSLPFGWMSRIAPGRSGGAKTSQPSAPSTTR